MVYKKRYEENKNIDYLYNVLISEILQRKVKNALITVNDILSIDKVNGNTYLTKSIINAYLIKTKTAKDALNQAKIYSKSHESEEILNTLEKILNIMNLKF